MNEIKCPKCGEVFQVDEAGYAAIVRQVKDKEFEREKRTHIDLALREAAEKHNTEINSKQNRINDLLKTIELNEKDAKLNLEKALNEKGIQHQKELAEKEQEIKDLEGQLKNIKEKNNSELETALAKKDNAIGFIFDGMEKNELFKTVIFDGALPRKTFSMGHAEDKRYYLECRRITK